jgi:hypothetical protein
MVRGARGVDDRRMRLLWKSVGMVAAVALVMAGCGADGDDGSAGGTTSGDLTTTTSALEPMSAADMDRFLVGADEAPGLMPSGEPLALSSLRALVEEFGAPEAEERRLRAHGFQLLVTQMLVGHSDAAGISGVDLFASADGATRELEYLLSNKEGDAPAGIENFEPFDVPGVPTATGWTFDKPGGHKAAEVHWTQGRCLLSLGMEPASIDQLRTGVRALYERTGGRCP